jgi:hypothetical protein
MAISILILLSVSGSLPVFWVNAAFYSLLGLVTFVAIATSFVYRIRRNN